MNAYLFVKYLHFLGIFGVVGTLFSELVLTRCNMSRRDVNTLAKIDGAYGAFTMLVLAAGFVLWFGVGKPAAFYSGNWVFIGKLVLFGVIGGLSIMPTVFFIRNRKGDMAEMVEIPRNIRLMIRLEVTLLFLLPLLATLMANGVGQG